MHPFAPKFPIKWAQRGSIDESGQLEAVAKPLHSRTRLFLQPREGLTNSKCRIGASRIPLRFERWLMETLNYSGLP
jgi:hypothetical protein